MANHRYWRIYVTASVTPAESCSLIEWKFYDSLGAEISTAGGTASASSEYLGYVATRVFDGNLSTDWISDVSPGTTPQWIKMAFASAIDVYSCLVYHPTGNYKASEWKIQYSDNDSDWVDASPVLPNQTWSTDFTCIKVPVDAVVGYYNWRIKANDTFGNGAVSCTELTLHSSLNGSQEATNGVIIADSSFGGSPGTWGKEKAFDGNSSTFWVSGIEAGFIGYILPVAKNIVEIIYKVRSDADRNGDPINFELQASNGGTWVTIALFTETSWTIGQEKTYLINIQPIILVIC